MTSSKQALHAELQLHYKEFLESKMATELLTYPEIFPSVKKISTAILKLLKENEKAVIACIEKNEKIINELKPPFFGSCYDKKEEAKSADILKKITGILEDKKPDLKQVMQIHCIFIHRIYDQLEKRTEKKEFVSKLFPSTLFSSENRSRTENKDVKLTTQLGIAKNKVFAKKIGKSQSEHLRAVEKYRPDFQSHFFKSAAEQNIPVVCGPSGHTGSLLLGAKLYGELTKDEMQEYAIACFAFLAAGGNHSFHEVMVVANLIGIDFKPNHYSESFPASLQETEVYKKLDKQFGFQ